MTTYEYTTEGFTPWSGASLTDFLNLRGAEGWQLVTLETVDPVIGYNAVNYRAVFMREKRSADDIGER